MITKEGTVEDTDAEPVLTTSTVWGDYQIDIANLGVGDVTATTDNLYGIILTDKDGKNYGLLHSDNTWLQTQEFSWAVDDVFSVHGQNHVPYQRTNGLNAGNTITKITYLLKDSADIVINTNVKLKTLIDTDKVNGSAEPATYNADGMTVKFNFNNLPSDDYTLATLVKGARHGKTVDPEHWNYDAKTQTLSVANDAYTVTFGAESFNLGAKATTALKYETSNDKVATVDENGNVTITGAGTAQITVKAAPKKQSVIVKAAKKKLTATWTKDKNATGYQLQIAINKNFKSAKTYTVTSYKTYKKTISKLKSKKTYYAKVRAYKISGKTKVYGAYSAVKSCKVK